jgi:hypothetical protein
MLPPYKNEDRVADKPVRLDLLSRISTLHIPFNHDLFISRSISRCINWGYISRNPMSFETTAKVMRAHNTDITPQLENYLTRAVFPIYGFSVLGISGVGKSSSVLNALMRYPKVVDHMEYNGVPFHCAQVVWLKVDCPGDGTPKGLCAAILRQLDATLGTSYGSEVSKRTSKDVFTSKVSQCLCSHHLGILVIDDIQNLCGVKKDASSDLLSFLIYLMETLAIPVVMVGTPKVLPFFQQEFQLAKRATGDGTVRLELLAENSNEWERFISGIWTYQFTKESVKLTPELSNTFFQESVGNPFLCSLLYKLVQDDAITCGDEGFSINDVKKVAREKLCITAQMRANMLAGRDEELRRYEALWAAAAIPPEGPAKKNGANPSKKGTDAITETINYVAQEMVKRYSIGLKQATKLATEAVAAKGAESRDVALGFAVKLYEAALDHKNGEKAQNEEGAPEEEPSAEGGGEDG